MDGTETKSQHTASSFKKLCRGGRERLGGKSSVGCGGKRRFFQNKVNMLFTTQRGEKTKQLKRGTRKMPGKTGVTHRESGGGERSAGLEAHQSCAGRQMHTPYQAPPSQGGGEVGDSNHWAILSQEYVRG